MRKGVMYTSDSVFAWEHHRKAVFSLKEGVVLKIL
jgi:hypothetical protein